MKIKIVDNEFLNKHKDIPQIFDEYDSFANNYITILDENGISYIYGNICPDCEEFHKEEDLTYIEDKDYYVCQDCLYSNYFYCDDCNNWYSSLDTNSYETENETIICQNCRDNYYVECTDCGLMVHENNCYYCEDCDRYYCSNCWNEHNHSNLLSYHSYHDWTPLKLQDEEEPPFYIGHELEIDEGYSQSEAVELINNKINCICMEDGSLSSYGIEIISQPLSYKYMLSQEQNYRDTFNKLANTYHYTSHNNDSCGLHFHVTRPQNEEVIDRIILFMETYKEEIIKLSRRTNEEIESWCNFLSDRRTANDKEIKSLDYIKKYKENSWRYMALNLTNYKTIEYRIFKGTLKYETFMADFEFVYNLTLLASDLSLPIEELTWTKVTSFGKFLPDYIKEHELQTDKPIFDYTQEIIIEINRKKEELQKEATIILKDLFDRMKKYLRKTQELNYNTLYTIHDKLYYGNKSINNIREIMGTLEYSSLDNKTLNDLRYKLDTIKTYMNEYLKKEMK